MLYVWAKTQGGMGFRDLHCFNQALLAKQCWRLWSVEDSLIAEIMKAKYHPRCSILEAQVGHKPSFAWRSIIGTRDLVKEGLVWRIGNGESAHIWGDKWLPTPSTYSVQSPPKILDRGALVRDLIDNDTRWWKKVLIEEIFNPEEARVIQNIPISVLNQPDKLVWRGNARGTFSVSSAYYMAKDCATAHQAECSVRVKDNEIWKEIWKLQIPNSWKNFMWRACHNFLPTRENLERRKIIQDPSCPICGREKETVYHVLWECIATKDVWGASKIFFQKSCFSSHDFLQVAEHFFHKCDRETLQMFVITARKIWFRRNTWLHEGKFEHPNMLVQSAQRAVEEIQSLHQSREESPTGIMEKWQKPEEGWLKLNCDAACDHQQGYMGMGVILRNHTGQVMAARSSTKMGFFEPAVAEAMSLLHGIFLCKELGVQNLIVEGDAQTVIKALQEGSHTGARFGHIVDDMRLALQEMIRWRAVHARREANGAAHSLARLASRNVIDRTWINSVPECICDTVLQELHVSV